MLKLSKVGIDLAIGLQYIGGFLNDQKLTIVLGSLIIQFLISEAVYYPKLSSDLS
jgi:hypothetical protein